MPKESKEQRIPNLAERKSLIAKEDEEIGILQKEVLALHGSGQAVDDLVKNISFIFIDLQTAQRTTDEGKFKKVMNKVSKRKKEIISELKRLSAIEKQETPKPQEEIKEEINEDVKELEAMAAGEDIEFKKHENDYFDAEKKLEEFVEYLGSFDLEKDKEKEIADYKDLLAELKILLKEKEYKRFAEVRGVFNDSLKETYAKVVAEKGFTKLEPGSKGKKEDISDADADKLAAENLAVELGVSKEQPEPEKKKAVKKLKPVVVKSPIVNKTTENIQRATPEQEEKEREDRRNFHEKLWQNFELLNRVIEVADKNDRNRKLFEKYDKDTNALAQILVAARKTEDIKTFDANINNFTKKFKDLTKNLEPDLKQAFENNGVFLKEEKKAEPENETELSLEDLQEVTEPENQEVKKAISMGPEPEVEIPIHEQPMVVEKKAEPKPEAKPTGEIPVESIPPTPEPKKKGLWSRFKDAILHPETKKMAKKVSYDTITSILGVKLITDVVKWARKGEGDIAEWWKTSKESKGTKDAITMAYQDLVASFTKVKENKVLAEYEKIENRLANFKAKVESAHISPEDKKALLDRVWVISMKHQEDSKTAVKERDGEIQRTLDAYLQAKVSGMKIARDAMNFALTATGMSMLRGLAYAGASIAERAGKAKREYAKQTAGAKAKKAELGFVAKDVIVNSAIETARALVGKGEQKGAGGVRRAVDFVKALGTMGRFFGIAGLTAAGTTAHEVAIDKFISGIKENGTALTFSKNIFENAQHVLHTYTHPSEIMGRDKEPEQPEIPSTPEHPPVVEREEILIPAEAPPGIGIDQIIAEHKLSPEFSDSLVNLLKKHPELSNQESIENILNASQIGPDVHSHHNTILKGTIDTLDESGGERRQVIFEEILKHGGPKAAADYLQNQHFSSQHLSHLSGYIRKGTSDEYLKFAEKYNTDDPRVVSGLFQAMQGKESTDLANAGLEVDAAGAKPGIDNHVRGEISYFGLENNKPVLSGSGSVTVDQMSASGEQKTLTTYKASEEMPAAEIKSVVPPVEKIEVPEKAPVSTPEPYADAPLNKFLVEHGSNQKEFLATYEKMVDATVVSFIGMEDSLFPEERANEFFQAKTNYLDSLQEKYQNSLEHGSKLSAADSRKIDKLLQAGGLFKKGDDRWGEILNQAVFGKEDTQVIELAFLSHTNPDTNPILTNNSHAIRIWSTDKKKDLFIYDAEKIFKLDNKTGNLTYKDSAGEHIITKEEALKMANRI